MRAKHQLPENKDGDPRFDIHHVGGSCVSIHKNAQRMTAPTPFTSWSPEAEHDSETRELADFVAGQSPLDAEAAAWWVRRQDGLDPEEEVEFQAWLAADPAHVAAHRRLGGVWSRLGDLPPAGIDALKAALPAPAQVQAQAIHATRSVSPANPAIDSAPEQPRRRRWHLEWARLVPQAAFAGLAAGAVGGGWVGWDHWQQQPTFAQTFATARGQQTEVRLPDGSQLRMDTATRAEVTLYRQRREVRLPEGQALFTVQSNATQPFDVLAGPLRITVVGTRFSVRHTASGLGEPGGGVSVVVEEGRVRVARVRERPTGSRDAQDDDAIELTAGQSVSADSQGHLAAVNLQPPGAATAWREGRVIFDGTPLAQALAEFERYANTGLVVNDPAVAAMRLNGSFDLRQFGAFQRALPQVLPVRLQPGRDNKNEIVQAR